MAYSASNKPFLIVPAVAGGAIGSRKGGNIWYYASSDSASTCTAPFYFQDGYTDGMQVNDLVIVLDLTQMLTAVCMVTACSRGYGATVAAPSTTLAGRGTFTLASGGATSTTLSVPAVTLTSLFKFFPQVGNQAAAEFAPWVWVSSQSAGSVTLSHPANTSGSMSFSYEVSS